MLLSVRRPNFDQGVREDVNLVDFPANHNLRKKGLPRYIPISEPRAQLTINLTLVDRKLELYYFL